MDATAQDLVARLRRNPDDMEAFAALRAHYQRIGDYASLANLLEGWAGRTPDKAAGSHAMYEAGELVLGALADRERAIRMYERALAIEPRHQDSFLRLRGLFEDAGEIRRLAELLERHGNALHKAGADPRDVALIFHQLGEIWEHRFSRVDKAVNHYRRAFELDPSFVAALYAAREIYRAAGNMKAAATLLEKEAKAEIDAARKVALWRELAHMKAEQLDDQEGAALALKRALAEAPGDLEVMTDLARVYLTRADRTKDAHIAASDRHRAADLLYQMSQQVPAEHALAYLEQSLDARPDHDGAMALFERMCDDLGQAKRLPGRWVAYLAHATERPEASYRRRRLADAYLAAGQVDYAVTCLEWLLDEGDPEAAGLLVDLYRRQGREEDAVRALAVAARGLPPAQRIPRLRELIAAHRDRGNAASAAEFAVQILELEPGDAEAINLLEDSCRETGDYATLREALLRASRASGSGPDVRKRRLKQVALLSEKNLDDPDGAISAWRGVTALDPADIEARSALKRLLTQAERWDELVDLLEREALTLTDPEPKAEVYRQLARIQRDRLGDLAAAVTALRNLRDLLPGDLEGRDELSEVLIEAGAFLEAVPLLRKRIDDTSGERRAELFRVLATILEEQVGDEEGAFEAWARLLDENPNDLDALAHMEAIDEAAGRNERLLSTLSYKAEVIDAAQKSAVLVQMANIADERLHDLERAADLYARALELAPGDGATLDALCNVYDRSERYRDLVVLLRETANREQDARRRAELYRRIARTLADPVGNEDGSAEAWREVLQAGEDEEALRFIRRHAAHQDDAPTLEDSLQRLSALVSDDAERRELLLERAGLLADRLDRPKDAILTLRKVVDELQPDHVGALSKLAALCELVKDLPGLADALWRQLEVVEDPGLRVPVARRLADLHEKEAPEVGRAVSALDAWHDADLLDPEPLRRLVPLLESASRWKELTIALDELAGLEQDPAEVSQLVRKCAQVAYRQLGDVDGAWARLEPGVREGDPDAEADLEKLAAGASQGERLAELYVGLAQTLDDLDDQKRRWRDAARIYESSLRDTAKALEAILRGFAVDLSDFAFLDEADRLAEKEGLWTRLAQVYETLVRRLETNHEKVDLLLRHAALLDTRAHDVSGALDQTLRACSLAPEDDAVLALAEERAPRAERADELLITYDKRRMSAEEDAGRVEALLRSFGWSENVLGDRARAVSYLAQAVALTVRTPDLSDYVEGVARDLDSRPGAKGGLRRAVVDIYAVLADDMEEDPVGGAHLLMRAARMLREDLASLGESFAALLKAAAFAPSEDDVLDELEARAKEQARLGDLDRHLAQLIEEALDSRTAAGLLRRRGLLLEEPLGRYDDAAEVWSRLATVAPDDVEARQRLRSCLRKAGKHQDLLVALQRDLRKASDPEDRLEHRKLIARVWEQDLANRWEALDAWKKVDKESPGDPEAREALERLGQETRRASEESDLAIAVPPSTDRSIPTPEPQPLSDEEPRVDEFEDLTVPSDEVSLAEAQVPGEEDSSETMLDDGMFEELEDALSAAPARPHEVQTAEHRSPRARETRKLDASQAYQAEPVTAEVDAAPVGSLGVGTPGLGAQGLGTPGLGAPGLETGAQPPGLDPDRPRPGPPEDFEDDYTAVGDDVFDQIRESFEPQADELHTGEIELLDEADARGALVESDVEEIEDLSGLNPIEDDALDELEELDEIEELEDIEELDDPSGSGPPPPPIRR